MKPRLSRALSAALALAVALPLGAALPACNESPAPGAAGAATASVKAEPAPTATPAATAAPTATAAATSDVTATGTAEPAPTATPTATATAKASAAPSTKATAKPTTAKTTPAPSSSPSSAPSATASAEPTASPTSAEIPPPAEGSADAIAQKVDTIFTPTKKNYFAKFKQKLEQKVTGQKKESTGTLNVERPNKVSFRYDPPSKNRVVADGTTLKAYIAEDSQMFESKVNSSAYAGGLAFFMGGLLKTMSFTFNTKADYKDGYVLIGKPRSPSPTYEYVMFYVNKALLEKGDPGCIERIVIVDAQGNKNRFDFTEAAFPASVPASEWEFTPPPGTNITKN